MKKKFPGLQDILRNRKSALSVTIVAIPLSLSLAIASGGTPIQGILTAVWAGMIAAIFGGSNYNIFGPAGALTGILLWFVILLGDGGAAFLPILAIVTGLFILLIYALKLTKYITLIPSTALHGFILWVGLIIISTQLSTAFGITGLEVHEQGILNFWELLTHLSSINWSVFGVFITGLALLITMKIYVPRFPWIIVVSVLGIILWFAIHNQYIPLQVPLLVDKYPDLAFSLFQIPDFQKALSLFQNSSFVVDFLMTAFTLAVIIVLETIISGKICDRMTKTRFKQPQEVFGSWLANIVSWIMWWIPASAVLLRSAINVKTGANSWISAFMAGLFTLIISAVLFSFFRMMPMALIAAILINVAIAMVDIKLYKKILYYDTKSLYFMLCVWLITWITDPIIWVIIWTAVGLLIHLYHLTQWKIYVTIFRDKKFYKKIDLHRYLQEQKSEDIIICKFLWEINFLTISSQIEQLEKLDTNQTIVFGFGQISDIDIDGVEALEELFEHLDSKWIRYYFCGLHDDVEAILQKTAECKKLEKEHRIFASSSEAISYLMWGSV